MFSLGTQHSPARSAMLPRWATRLPNVSLPSAGLSTPNGVAHHDVYTAGTAMGAYNHGPIIASHGGMYVLSWYNGVLDESAANRVLFAISRDGETWFTWSKPRVLFNTTAGVGHLGSWILNTLRLQTTAGSLRSALLLRPSWTKLKY